MAPNLAISTGGHHRAVRPQDDAAQRSRSQRLVADWCQDWVDSWRKRAAETGDFSNDAVDGC